jgi:hypothetical protein
MMGGEIELRGISGALLFIGALSRVERGDKLMTRRSPLVVVNAMTASTFQDGPCSILRRLDSGSRPF